MSFITEIIGLYPNTNQEILYLIIAQCFVNIHFAIQELSHSQSNRIFQSKDKTCLYSDIIHLKGVFIYIMRS